MKMHIIIPAIASLALFAANPASALTQTANPLQGATLAEPTDGIVFAVSKDGYDCRAYANRWARLRCDEINGQPAPY
jgi:hypothetical protein